MKDYVKMAGKALLMLTVACGIFLLGGLNASAAELVESVELPLDGTWKAQNISSDDDIVYWELNVPSDGKVEVSVQTFRDSTYWCLYNEDRTKEYFNTHIDKGSAAIPGNGSKTWYLSKGKYYLMAKDNYYLTIKSFGDVQMKAVFTSAGTTETEPNNSWGQAMPLESGNTVRGILTDFVDREDFYRIQVEKKGVVTFRLVGMFEEAALEVYGSDYTQVTDEAFVLHDGTETAPEVGSLEKELEPGTYYLKIRDNFANRKGSGIYELSWEPPYIPVTSVTLDKNELLLTKKGQEAVLKETVLPADADNKKVKWKSDKPSVATVDNGKVTAVSDGTATITVTTEDKGLTAKCKVRVEIPKLEDAVLTLPKTIYAYTGKSITPQVTVTHKGTRLKEGTDYTVSYKNNINVGDNASATVTGKGGYVGQKTITFQIKIDTTKTYSVGSLKYKITSISQKSACVVGVKSVGKSSITIPAAVKILGDTYKVDQVQAKAFQKNKKLKTIVIGKNIKTIDAKAFYGCSKLSKIQVKTKVLQKVGSNALKGTKKKIRIELPKKYYQAYKKMFEKKGQTKIRFVKK